jgi:HEAT repeat protein
VGLTGRGTRQPKVDKLWRRGNVPGLMRAIEFGLDGDESEAEAGAPVRAEAAQALAQAEGDGVSEALVRTLGDPSPAVREVVIDALYERGSRRAFDPLCAAVMRWTAPEHAPGRGGALAVLEAMRDPEVAIRVANDLLDREGPLTDGDREVISRLAVSAPEGLPKTVRHLLPFLSDPARGPRAAQILVWLSPASVEPLIEALDDDGTRQAAASALGYTHDKRAVEPLCSLMLENPDPAVRRVAAWALGEIRDLMAMEALMLASNDADYNVRTEAARAFDAFGNVGLAMAVSALMPTPELPPSSGDAAPAGALTGAAPTEDGAEPEQGTSDPPPAPPEPASAPRRSDAYEPPASVLGLLRSLRRRHTP